ncbi:MAG TPA: YitT family protein [Opitutaceae bacterium]|nr:YitT family protein [Opitutaceae bacterium]
MASAPILSHRRTIARSSSRDLALVVCGAALVALSFNLLLRPNQLAPGGLPGVSLLVERATGLPPAFSQALLNVGFLLFGWRALGRGFVLRSLLGSLLLPLFVWCTHDWGALTHDRMLAVLCGGAGTGVGVGLVFRGGGSVGGFSALALVAQRKWHLPVDRTLLTLDGAVVALAALAFPADAVLGALVGVFIIGRSARAVLTGFSNAQCGLIVTRHPAAIREAVLHELDLGLTVLPAQGGYTGEVREVLMVVMRPADVPRLKATVRALDSEAFVVLVEADEVLGYGFKPNV